MNIKDMDFDLTQELNDYISKTYLSPFWEASGYKAQFMSIPDDSSPELMKFNIFIKITKGHLSPKAGAPC